MLEIFSLKPKSGIKTEVSYDALPSAALLAATGSLLSACGGGDGAAEGKAMATQQKTLGASLSAYVFPPILTQATHTVTTHAEAARFLARAGFGGSEQQRQSLISSSLEQWIKDQFEMPQGQSRWDEASALQGSDSASFAVDWEQQDNLQWKRIVAFPDVLRQRITLALSELFVVTAAGTNINAVVRTQALMAYVDMLENLAFSNFRQILEAVTLSLQMGCMLGTLNNLKEDPAINRKPDENFAREVMQLFTIGLYELNPDGTEKLDSLGRPIETYTQDTVSNLARVFTGWSYPLGSSALNPDTWRQAMRMKAANHSTLEKNFLGMTIPAGVDGVTSLKIALDTLFNHPNVAPFIGRQLIQRLVTSNPSPAYIARVAAVFADNGLGVRGDMLAVVSAVLLDAEALAAPDTANPLAGKWSEPIVRVGILIRAFRFTSPDGQWRLYKATALGQAPLKAPSVFNFFRPGYVPPNSQLAAQRMTAPEMQIMSEQTVIAQINFLSALFTDPGAATSRTYLDTSKALKSDLASTGLALDLSSEQQLAIDSTSLIEHLNLLLAAGQLAATSRQIIATALNKMPLTNLGDADSLLKLQNRVKVAILMVMVAPEAQLLL